MAAGKSGKDNSIKIAGPLAELALKFMGELREYEDSHDPNMLRIYTQGALLSLIKNPSLAADDPTFLATALLGQIEFTPDYWFSWLGDKTFIRCSWEEVKQSIRAREKGRAILTELTSTQKGVPVVKSALALIFILENLNRIKVTQRQISIEDL